MRAAGGITILLSILVLIRVAGEPFDRSLLASIIAAVVALGVLALLNPLLVKWCAAEDRMWQAVGRRLRRFANRNADPF